MEENPSLESDIQSESFNSMAKLLLVGGYIWLALVIYPFEGVGHSLAAWIGSLNLVIFPAISLKLYDRFNYLVPFFLLGGTCISISAAIVEFQRFDLGYLFILPVIFSGVFARRTGTILLVFLSIIGIVVSRLILNFPFIWMDNFFQILIIVIAGLASLISASRLYLALDWAQSSFERARENEQIVVGQRAELIRVLKVVDNLAYQYERTNNTLKIERDRSEEGRRLKQEFAQNISHELRTPLGLIVGFSQLMLESPDHYGLPISPTFVRDLDTIHRNALHLQSLTNDVLELAGVDAGTLSLAVEWVDPVELVRDVIETASELTRQKGVELKLVVESNIPKLWADPARIRQVFFNLLNNAARFTERGDVTIRIRQDGEDMLFSVQDTGIGIPPEMTTRIFEEFVQVKEKGKNRGGSGLGLAISRRFVEMHNGRIWAESELGKGSTFYFTLPVSPRSSFTQIEFKPSQLPNVPVNGEPKDKILLVVTQSPSVANLLNHRLKGGRTVVIKNFGQIETVIKELRPQAVLLDESSGNLAYSNHVDRLVSLGIPLLMCSLPGEGKLIEDLGVDDYLIKPVTREIILDIVHQFGEDINKILIADDDRDFAQLFSRVLDLPSRHYLITQAETRSELLDLMNLQPDLVIISLRLSKWELGRLVQDIRMKADKPDELRIIIIEQGENAVWGNPISGPITIHVQGGMHPGTFVQVIQEIMDAESKTL